LPTLKIEKLHDIGVQILEAYGLPEEEAELVTRYLLNANLSGMDSHGIIRLPQYCQRAAKGLMRTPAKVEVLKDTPTLSIVDGHWSFGAVVATRAVEMALDKAEKTSIAVSTVRRCCHVGRLGEYVEMAVRRNMLGIAFCNLAGSQIVAPFGGSRGRLSTNPFAIGAPKENGRGLVLDFATSFWSEGKIRVYHHKREQLPEHVIRDSEGHDTTEPGEFYGPPRGSILPFGGPMVGYKGYALSMMMELVGGVLAGAGACGEGKSLDNGPIGNGVTYIALNIKDFVDPDQFKEEADALVKWVKGCPLAPGYSEILVPGEKEERCEKERRETGIQIADETWRQITECAQAKGLDLAA